MASQAAQGKKALEAGDYETAIKEFTAAIKASPTSADFFIQRATAYQRAKKDREALADAEQGEEKDVGHHKVAWQDSEGRKNGLYEWRCSVEAGKEVTLLTNWDVKAPADVKWIETPDSHT